MPVWMIFRSVAQTPQARTRTSTSSSPGTGTGRSSSSKRWGATSTVAFIVAGISMSSFLSLGLLRAGLYTTAAVRTPMRVRSTPGLFRVVQAGARELRLHRRGREERHERVGRIRRGGLLGDPRRVGRDLLDLLRQRPDQGHTLD